MGFPEELVSGFSSGVRFAGTKRGIVTVSPVGSKTTSPCSGAGSGATTPVPTGPPPPGKAEIGGTELISGGFGFTDPGSGFGTPGTSFFGRISFFGRSFGTPGMSRSGPGGISRIGGSVGWPTAGPTSRGGLCGAVSTPDVPGA